jgi:hypothetical protein
MKKIVRLSVLALALAASASAVPTIQGPVNVGGLCQTEGARSSCLDWQRANPTIALCSCSNGRWVLGF